MLRSRWVTRWLSQGTYGPAAGRRPTPGIALVIAWRARNFKSGLAHNLFIVFRISVNSCWMLNDFFGFDTVRIGTLTGGKHLAIVPSGIGLGILAYYYLVQKPRESMGN